MRLLFICLFSSCIALCAHAQQVCYEGQLNDGDKYQKEGNIKQAILNWQSALDFCDLTEIQRTTLRNRIENARTE